jgi:hypothetical protein
MSFESKEEVERISHFLIQAGVVCGALLLWELLIKISDHNLIPAPSAAIAALNELIIKGVLVDDLTESSLPYWRKHCHRHCIRCDSSFEGHTIVVRLLESFFVGEEVALLIG